MSKNPKFAGIILAAGSGSRLGGTVPKQYQSLDDEPLLCHSVRTFLHCDEIATCIVVVPRGDIEQARRHLGELADKVTLIEGGVSRQQSASFGLRALRDLAPDYVHIHDGARPFVTAALLNDLTARVTPENGVIPALDMVDTLKKADTDGKIVATLDRQGLIQVQTPQCFPFTSILAAHEQAAFEGKDNFTDDSSVAEWYGLTMQFMRGDVDNIKITHGEDLERANRLLLMRKPFFPDLRTGNGYDVHVLEAGDGVTLCGVTLPCPYRLSGHSDGDVALHALTDALLATIGAGDIGSHFPPSEEKWRGAASDIFVRHALNLVRARDGRLANIDITLIAEIPKIAPHRVNMVAHLASLLDVDKERVSVKATTNECLGFIGRREGIAAIATANVLYPGQVPEGRMNHD